MLQGRGRWWQALPGDVPLEDPDHLGLGPALGQAAGHAGPGPGIAAQPVITMPRSAQLACRSPPRLSRQRVTLPEDAGMGAVPHRCAQAASDRSRPGLSPAV
jgi:hypothetical protein